MSPISFILSFSWLVSIQQGTNAAALHVIWDRQVCDIQKGRCEIHITADAGAICASFNFSRVPDQERHLKRLFIDEPFVEPSVFAKKKALIRGVDHDRIFGQASFVKVIQNSADAVVNGCDCA